MPPSLPSSPTDKRATLSTTVLPFCLSPDVAVVLLTLIWSADRLSNLSALMSPPCRLIWFFASSHTFSPRICPLCSIFCARKSTTLRPAMVAPLRISSAFSCITLALIRLPVLFKSPLRATTYTLGTSTVCWLPSFKVTVWFSNQTMSLVNCATCVALSATPGTSCWLRAKVMPASIKAFNWASSLL